jgi:hypothetical protein
MDLWMSGEIQSDIGDDYRNARKDIVSITNDFLNGKEYGEGLKSWNYIAIIREIESEDYNEVHKYNKRNKETEFRLKINYNIFRSADNKEKKKLICQSLVRSISILQDIGISNFDIKQFKDDIVKLYSDKGWI